MKLLLSALGILASTCAPVIASEINITAEKLQFTYEVNEGDGPIACTHKIENAQAQDWKVVCSEGKFKKEYSVHLWVTAYPWQKGPKISYEILYWVTDWSDKFEPLSHGSTSWVHLKDKADLYRLDLSQHVDKGTASLRLQLTP